jgi:deacetoxycephalosporin-C hydroxylase
LRPSPSFAFSIAEAWKYGLDVYLDTDTATFGDWIGSNYIAMQTAAAALP